MYINIIRFYSIVCACQLVGDKTDAYHDSFASRDVSESLRKMMELIENIILVKVPHIFRWIFLDRKFMRIIFLFRLLCSILFNIFCLDIQMRMVNLFHLMAYSIYSDVN